MYDPKRPGDPVPKSLEANACWPDLSGCKRQEFAIDWRGPSCSMVFEGEWQLQARTLGMDETLPSNAHIVSSIPKCVAAAMFDFIA